ncbi:Gldg family protein [Chitinophaga sp. 30R24]|uniref:Gldg family protein n=1 Tax=Chitinophaga sp. 30R24 TaxID=3248838 RepID=UPI003B918F2E
MKTVFKIAKTELRLLFYSPIAWFLMIVFLVQCALTYVNGLDTLARSQEGGSLAMRMVNMRDFTLQIFGRGNGVFSSVMEKLYFYIPLLTMGLISRETNSGTIKLLYSSPVKVWEMVLGKYVSMMVYSLLMIGILGIFFVAALFNIKSVDMGILLSGALGFYLLLCAYSAIGLFMSCLTSYQVVAAVCSFVMIGFLSYVGTLWQQIDFVRDLTYFLSLSGRTEHMLMGLITSKDVLYFVIITGIFLGLSICKLKAGRESKPAMVSLVRYTAVIAVALLVGYISSLPRFTGYYDSTANKARTLTPNAQRVIKELGDAPLEIITYNNLLSSYYFLGLPDKRNMLLNEFWEPYVRFKPDISFKFVNYYDSAFGGLQMAMMQTGSDGHVLTLKESAERLARSVNLKMSTIKTPEEIHRTIDLKPEMNRFVMLLKYKGNTTYLRVFDDMMMLPGETEVSAAFKRLLQAKLPKIAYLNGHLERSVYKAGDREYQGLTNIKSSRFSLINQGFDVDSLSLDTQDIPADVSTLVIADPKTNLQEATLLKVRKYIDQGGNILIAGEPGKQGVINPLLQQLGVQLMDGIIVQQSKEYAPDLALPVRTAATNDISALSKAFQDSSRISMPGATGLTYTSDSSFQVQPLLMTDGQQSWLRKDKLVTDSGEVFFSAANGDNRGPIPVMLSLTRKRNGKEQRIIVSGDADFMSNVELNRGGVGNNIRTDNFLFSTALFGWLNNGEFPIDTRRPQGADDRINTSSDNIALLRILLVWVLPGILAVFAIILLIRRKRK